MTSEALNILAQYSAKVPDSVLGPERVRFIIEHIDEINLEQKSILVKFANYILTAMIERQASDIEIGGHGTEGHVWLRISIVMDWEIVLVHARQGRSQLKNGKRKHMITRQR